MLSSHISHSGRIYVTIFCMPDAYGLDIRDSKEFELSMKLSNSIKYTYPNYITKCTFLLKKEPQGLQRNIDYLRKFS